MELLSLVRHSPRFRRATSCRCEGATVPPPKQSGMEIRKYYKLPMKGNAVHSPVHMFYARPDRRGALVAKKIVSATLYPSFSHPGINSYQVIVASANELVSRSIEEEYGNEADVQPITVAKHLAEVVGMELVVIDKVFCDTGSCDVIYDLHYFQAPPTIRDVIGRLLLDGAAVVGG